MIAVNFRKIYLLKYSWPMALVLLTLSSFLLFPTELVHPEEEKPIEQILVKEREHPVLGPRLQQTISRAEDTDRVVVWVFFTDKGIFTETGYATALKKVDQEMSARVKKRRAKMGHQNLFDFKDLPVYQGYINKIVPLSVRHRTTSKWFNAISIEVEVSRLERIGQLSFVRRIESVATSKRTPLPDVREEEETGSKSPPRPHTNGLNYGSSLRQLSQINVPAVHALGYDGEGVIICILDTGFFRDHESLEHLDLIAEWDFIFNDGNTANETEDTPSQHSHGSEVLSVVGGAKDGRLYGPAYNASFLLAKTEYIPTETRVEEDYWVAGIEWADVQGADVATSSLGYSDWYDFEDYDGNTATTTKAADIAASRGIVVCNSMGNNGQWAGSIVAPADADSIIACGAVNSNGGLAGFSSSGPTYDGRTKPEVCAQGSSVYAAVPSTYRRDTYTSNASGTSFSTPLVAGCAALVLQAHPDWTPLQVREALMMTASRSSQPDNNYGWGVVDCLKAIEYQQASMDPYEGQSGLPIAFALSQNYPNPFNTKTDIRYQIPDGRYPIQTTLKIYNVLGQEVKTLVDKVQREGYYTVSWDGLDMRGLAMPSGFYFYRLQVADFTDTKTMLLLK
jgi:serine protease AprX